VELLDCHDDVVLVLWLRVGFGVVGLVVRDTVEAGVRRAEVADLPAHDAKPEREEREDSD